MIYEIYAEYGTIHHKHMIDCDSLEMAIQLADTIAQSKSVKYVTISAWDELNLKYKKHYRIEVYSNEQ